MAEAARFAVPAFSATMSLVHKAPARGSNGQSIMVFVMNIVTHESEAITLKMSTGQADVSGQLMVEERRTKHGVADAIDGLDDVDGADCEVLVPQLRSGLLLHELLVRVAGLRKKTGDPAIETPAEGHAPAPFRGTDGFFPCTDAGKGCLLPNSSPEMRGVSTKAPLRRRSLCPLVRNRCR